MRLARPVTLLVMWLWWLGQQRCESEEQPFEALVRRAVRVPDRFQSTCRLGSSTPLLFVSADGRRIEPAAQLRDTALRFPAAALQCIMRDETDSALFGGLVVWW